ncbi:MAG: hypothetical protein V4685_14780 [Bacteroidota bacterium]
MKQVIAVLVMLLAVQYSCMAQEPVKVYKIKDGRMYIMLSKHLTEASVDSFITDYNLDELQLKKVLSNNGTDSLVKAGWKVELNNNELIALSKKLGGVESFKDPSIDISVSDKFDPRFNNFPAVSSNVKYGINRFSNKNLFAINDSVVTFFLRNHADAKQVMLAGSFNDWSTTALKMTATEGGWLADVKLAPGKYWYKFIIDGNWDIDRDNKLVENDGKGNDNSVFYKPNYIFRSHAFANSKELYVAGSFNNWNDKELALVKTSNGWAMALYLADGTHTYRYIADGKWSEDPENNDHFPNELGQYNSVIRLGKQHVFKLTGFTTATKITLLGSFNNWKDDELLMKKVSDGWELPYAIGRGNYEYTFKVDGKWVSGDNNSHLTGDPDKANYFNLILDPNYTFRLKGFDDAKDVFLSGDFNNWSPNTYRMIKEGDEWIINLHIDKGKHVYKYVVDGKWMLDPGNNLWEQNEHQTGNSVLWIDE